jgi:hypothetical protein
MLKTVLVFVTGHLLDAPAEALPKPSSMYDDMKRAFVTTKGSLLLLLRNMLEGFILIAADGARRIVTANKVDAILDWVVRMGLYYSTMQGREGASDSLLVIE